MGWYRMDDPDHPPPRDGTVIVLRNDVMAKRGDWVRGHFGALIFDGREYENRWVSDFTDNDFMPFPSGRLVCPDEWRPAPPGDDA